MTTTTASRWVLDPAHSLAEFAIKHMMIATVKGRFGKLEGTVTGALPDLTTAEITASIDAASIDTREPQRDAHLRSADFFDVENHPTITFKSTRITRAGEGMFQIAGDLTIRGVTQPVTLTATFAGFGKDPWGNERAAFSAETTINRKDFGLQWNALLETGGVLVGEVVKVVVEAELIRQAN